MEPEGKSITAEFGTSLSRFGGALLRAAGANLPQRKNKREKAAMPRSKTRKQRVEYLGRCGDLRANILLVRVVYSLGQLATNLKYTGLSEPVLTTLAASGRQTFVG